jgi:thiamine-monophosphate kinase
VTRDAIVEGVHFTRKTFSLEDIGHKALAVNLSDLAAMGAIPSWFVCALALPRRYGPPEVRRIASGMSALARRARIALVGGNFTSASELSITITAAGDAQGRFLTRSGARPDDVLFVSGSLGDARLGLELLSRGRAGQSSAVRRQRRPVPRLGLGRLARGHASAAIDVSDGLGQDLGHLCTRSRVGAEVDLSSLPVSRALLREKGQRAHVFAAQGGEDYELLLAVPARRAAAFERACARGSIRITRIGRIISGRSVTFRAAGGRRVRLGAGFDHFA